jgi:hypothetical protein
VGATARFTLRFRNPTTHELLGLVAARYGVSKNQLAEEMLERELRAAALALELDLRGTLDLPPGYGHPQQVDQAIEDFAEAEAYEEDPIKARMLGAPATKDVHGVLDSFTGRPAR